MKPDHRPADAAIACARDGDVWNQFVPASADTSGQRYRVVGFHFKEGTDAAGFVAWLAAHLKRSAGTGSVVICGKDRRDTPGLFQTSQGVFDYWCCSVGAGDKFVAVIRSLITQGKRLGSSQLRLIGRGHWQQNSPGTCRNFGSDPHKTLNKNKTTSK